VVRRQWQCLVFNCCTSKATAWQVTEHAPKAPPLIGLRQPQQPSCLVALNWLLRNNEYHIRNHGTGTRNKVLEVIKQLEMASGKKIPYQLTERREGDIMIRWADIRKIEQPPNWRANHELNQMTIDTRRWHKLNPKGCKDN